MVSHTSCIYRSVTSETYSDDVQIKTQFVFGLLRLTLNYLTGPSGWQLEWYFIQMVFVALKCTPFSYGHIIKCGVFFHSFPLSLKFNTKYDIFTILGKRAEKLKMSDYDLHCWLLWPHFEMLSLKILCPQNHVWLK